MRTTASLPDLEEIIRIVRECGGAGASLREIVKCANVARRDHDALRRGLRELVEAGRIVRLPRGRYGLPARERTVTGRLTLHPDGYGFVRADDGGKDVFIPRHAVAGARHGDRVMVRVNDEEPGGRRSGAVSRVVEATGRRIVGLLRSENGKAFLVPLDRSAGAPVPLRGALPEGASDGALIVGDLGRSDARHRALTVRVDEAVVVKVLGRPGDPGVDEAVVSEKYGLPRDYPEGAVRDAQDLAGTAMARLRGEKREDFRDWTTVTIDGRTAKDFDDAISIRGMGGGRVRLAVHIADVASFVPEGSEVDREAAGRATSIYFTGSVVPMLPQLLSDNLCSLVPGEDRPVQSVVMDFDRAGRRVGLRFADGWIRSRARLTYDEVAEFLEGNEKRLESLGLGDDLRLMGGLATLLRKRRLARGSLDFDLPEPEVLLDIDGATSGIVAGERNDAHRLIEEFMLAGNEAVAETLDAAGHPSLYRIHEPPDPLKIEALLEAIQGLGYGLPRAKETVRPSDLAAIVERASGRAEERFVHTVVLRSLMQARYSEKPAEHFGLAAERYTHFTSPIRRYPDLVVHRILRAHRRGREEGDVSETLERLGGIARHCSRKEREAESAERELLERKIVGFMRGRVGERFAGFITGVIPFGLFVQLVDVFAEGFVPVEALPEDSWTHEPRSHRLVGTRTGRILRLGDRLAVDVVRVDTVFQRIELSLAEEAGGGVAAHPPARGLRRDSRGSGGAATEEVGGGGGRPLEDSGRKGRAARPGSGRARPARTTGARDQRRRSKAGRGRRR